MHARILSRFSHDQVSVTLWTAAHQAPVSVGILQARILERFAMSSSRGSSPPRDRTHVSLTCPTLAGKLFTTSATCETHRYYNE